ncbi:ATP-binding cassette domain-containing protein [Actinomadura rupiterrae]|uniref:ATP-binding cassette domain-containing protein n=1 Tax=Actinomadura rupiterrae TaxID=559627 RepID=UPI0020A5EE93|nr:ATP-binding cassette domain-containing protein [Actinomadura rupiterrae]MCP2339832.1 D-xylose transport system ATP-binding protein [Actinomadura rupiterrae]
MSAAVLEARGIGRTFGAVRALTDVTLELRAGEVTALVGDNGAGKSTLVKILSGVVAPDAGRILLGGEPVRIARPHDARALGIATVHQDLGLCENLDVVANLFLGAEPHRWSLLRSLRMERTARDLLASLDVRIPDLRTPVASLSGGQRQSVAIARALLGEPRVVLLDEPTAALGVEQTAQVLALIRRLRDRGLAVLVISHNLADVRAVSDRIAVLRLGRDAGVFRTSDTATETVVAAITGAGAAA